jgi:hypothetical protein
MSHTLSRRNFLRTGLYGVAGAALVGPAVLRTARAAHSEPVEAVVIGSSFTIAALAERCMDALVPEVIDGRSKVLAAA